MKGMITMIRFVFLFDVKIVSTYFFVHVKTTSGRILKKLLLTANGEKKGIWESQAWV